MEKINSIWNHPLYQSHYRKIAQLEKDRIFCCHGITHLLDVARNAWILNLERGYGFDKEVIYGAALLHDIGKDLQYTEKIPHEIAGEEIARQILEDLSLVGGETCSEKVTFTPTERDEILVAIRGHRRQQEGASLLASLLYESDKASRCCFSCEAEQECNWKKEKKNMEIKI